MNRQARDLQRIAAIWPKPLQPFPTIKESTDLGSIRPLDRFPWPCRIGAALQVRLPEGRGKYLLSPEGAWTAQRRRGGERLYVKVLYVPNEYPLALRKRIVGETQVADWSSPRHERVALAFSHEWRSFLLLPGQCLSKPRRQYPMVH